MKISNVTPTQEGKAAIRVQAAKAVKKILDDIADDARRVVPKDTEELHDSIDVEYIEGATDGKVTVGTDHWAPTEYGSAPHVIESQGDYSLHNSETGEYFGKRVNHPGTPEQPFMRPSLYKKRRVSQADLV
jgi:bacteriophage HK97-gp10 putative tail-component